MQSEVYIGQCSAAYDSSPLSEGSRVRRTLQDLWRAMGREPENPFRQQLARGGLAVIKPNWVMDINPTGGGIECLITHSSLIACMMHWCAVALDGEGTVVVGDAPVQGCDFAALLAAARFDDVLGPLRQLHPRVDFRVQDWRLTVMDLRRAPGDRAACGHQPSPGSLPSAAENYSEIDLGPASFLEDIAEFSDRFRVTMYRPSLLQEHHRPGRHEYLVRNEALTADLFINLAKMKTHEKAGLTGALKNLVGINGHKEYLPHHIRGSYFAGGDCYCRHNFFAALGDRVYDWWWEQHSQSGEWKRWWHQNLYTALRAAARLSGGDHIAPGSWSGNETIWRTTLDLNHLLYFGARRPKHIFNLVDAIVAGEGQGPLRPTPKPLGLLVAGENPASIDAVLARIIGYNLSRVPTVYHAVNHRKSQFGGVDLRQLPVVFAGETPRTGTLLDVPVVGFQPPQNWQRAMSPIKSV